MFEEGSNLKSIGVQAFSGCYNLNVINLPDSLTELKAGASLQCFAIFDVKIEVQSSVLDQAPSNNMLFEQNNNP